MKSKSFCNILSAAILIASLFVHIDAKASRNIYQNHKAPKLVVVINVEQMRHDYLHKYNHNFSSGGIKRMMQEGISYSNARYNFMFTQSSPGVATIMTGTQPSQHGIIGDGWINYTTNTKIDAAADKSYMGVGCNEDEGCYSPKNLLVSTVGDELKKHSPKSKVLSISLTADRAVFASGKTGNAAYWFDERYGGWVTSNYYQDKLPAWVDKYNASDKKVDLVNKLWHISRPYDMYTHKERNKVMLDSVVKITFGTIFKPNNTSEYGLMREKPMGNSYITDFAMEAISCEEMGTDDGAPDMIVLNYGILNYLTKNYGIETMDIEDAIYRLDDDIEKLLNFLDEKVGKEGYVAIFTSSHGTSNNITTEKGMGGKFNATQFRVMMGGFMNAQYGEGEWVSEYRNRQLYLNRRLIFEKGLSLSDIQNSIATFTLQFNGVAQCITATALQNNYYGKSIMQKIQNSFFPKHSGDVIINLLPGWIEVEGEEDKSNVLSSSGSPYEYDTHVPLIWLGTNVVGETVHRNIDMTDVAPTIAELLSIPHPNASEGEPISEVINELN